jgi:hypothetical protein
MTRTVGRGPLWRPTTGTPSRGRISIATLLGCLAFLAAATATATAAWAQNAPLTQPTRDVDVVYMMAGPNGPLVQRMRWGVTAGRLRVDPPTPGMYVIIDTISHSMQAVREGDRSVVTTNAGPNALPGTTPAGHFQRSGDSNVAGLGCTQWKTQDTAGRQVLACLTPDGVLLRAEADGLVLVEALSVDFAPLPAAVFRVPADYRKITPPPLSQKRP